MCIAVFIWKSHPLYSLILLLNRDEYHNRPTDPLSWWDSDDAQPILGGRDVLAGGTWLACSKDGRLAFLTNVREIRLSSESQHQPKSRGYLPLRFLKSKKSPKDFAEELMLEANNYEGFNLIVADLCSLSMEYITNRPKETGTTASSQVSPGVHVLSNAMLDTPWPKSQRLERSFKAVIEECADEIPLKELPEKLMRDMTKDDVSKLPHIYPLEREYQLSSIYVDFDTPMGRYGTRSTSMVSVQKSGYVTFDEIHLDKEVWKDQSISFQIEKERTTNN